MTAAEMFVKRMMEGINPSVIGDMASKGEGNGEVKPIDLKKHDETFHGGMFNPEVDGGEEDETNSEDEQGYRESALDVALEYLRDSGNDDIKPGVFSKGWAIRKSNPDSIKGKEKTAQDELYEALVGDESPENKTLAEHDKERHKGGFDPKTDTCKFRERLATETEEDKGDILEPKKGGNVTESTGEEAKQVGEEKGKKAEGSDNLPKAKVYEGLSKKKSEEYGRLMAKKHPEMDADLILTELGKIADKKIQADAFAWVMRGAVKLPEDLYKVEQARELATKAKKDPLSYNTPQACINELMGEGHKLSEKPISVEELKKNPLMSDYRDEGYGVETFQVEDSKAGQKLMRKVIDTHWGKDANPWCLLARREKEPWERMNIREDYEDAERWWHRLSRAERQKIADKIYKPDTAKGIKDEFVNAEYITEAIGADDYYFKQVAKPDDALEQAWEYWNNYNALPKRVAFKDGQLLAFMATDKMDFMDAFEDAVYGSGSRLAKMYPQEFAEFEAWEETDEGKEEGANFYEWLEHNHPELVSNEGLRAHTPEEWWDRQDEPHKGIPIGVVEVPDDELHRKGEGELVKGEVVIPEGQELFVGEEGKPGFKKWSMRKPQQKIEEVTSDGTLIRWFDNGEKHVEAKPNGERQEWNMEGKKLFERDADGNEKTWDCYGTLRYEKFGKIGEKHYDAEGMLLREIKPDGEIVVYKKKQDPNYPWAKKTEDELVSALMGERNAEDALPSGETLEEHDRKRHGGHFGASKQSCKNRDEMEKGAEEDRADIVSAGEGIQKEIKEFGEGFWESVYGKGQKSFSEQYGEKKPGEDAREAYERNFTKGGKYKSPLENGKISKDILKGNKE